MFNKNNVYGLQITMKESEQKGDMEGSTEHFEGEIMKREKTKRTPTW